MNWLDIAIVLLVVAFALAAYSAGLIREVVTLLAAVIGVVVAGALYRRLAGDVLVFMDDADAAEAISFLVLFGAVYLFGQIVAYILKSGASLLMLGWADRLGGAFFGLVKGLIVVQILLIIFAAYPSLHFAGAVHRSALAGYFIDDFSFLLRLLPSSFDHRIDRFLVPQQG